jgi:hypothetical protein
MYIRPDRTDVATRQRWRNDRMNIHKNARTTPDGRAEIVRRAQRTVARWLAHDRADGREGLAERSWRPQTIPGATPADVVEQVMALRRQRLCGKQIATSLALSAATVRRILRQVRLSRQRDLDPPEPVRRDERQHPGERIHIDIKQLGRCDCVGHRITGDRTKQSNARGSRDGTTWGAGWWPSWRCGA